MKTLETLKTMSINSIIPVNMNLEIYIDHHTTKAREYSTVGYITKANDNTAIVELSHFSRYRYEREGGAWGEKGSIRIDHSNWKFEAKDEFIIDGNFPRTDEFNESFYATLLLNTIYQNKYLYIGNHDTNKDWILLNTQNGDLKNNPIIDLFFYDQYSLGLYLGGQIDGYNENGEGITKEEKVDYILNKENKYFIRAAFDLIHTPYNEAESNLIWIK